MRQRNRPNLGKVTSVRLEPAVLRRLGALRAELEADPILGPAGPWTPAAVARYVVTAGVAAVEAHLRAGRHRARSR